MASVADAVPAWVYLATAHKIHDDPGLVARALRDYARRLPTPGRAIYMDLAAAVVSHPDRFVSTCRRLGHSSKRRKDFA